jgi:septal ring factor EnvC (AmiA/AmiB activator)
MEVRGMNGIKTVDDLIRAKELTPEEEEQLRDIIEECRKREAQLQDASDTAKRNIEALTKSFGMIVDTIYRVGRAVDELHEEVERLQLRMMPEEQFYRE